MNRVLYQSNKDDWETPQELFNKMNKEFNFTIDVASSDANCKCKKHYTKQNDGLQQDWNNEVVWCNPLYGRNIGEWVKKAFFSNAITVMLLPARTDTRWFHEYIYNKDSVKIKFIKGRLKFGNAKNSAPFPSMIVIFYPF